MSREEQSEKEEYGIETNEKENVYEESKDEKENIVRK